MLATCDDSLRLLSQIGARHAAACPLVVADRVMADYQWLARELGAVHFVTSPRRLDELLAIVRRRFDSLPAAQRTSGESIFETILESLPWR